VGLRPAVAYRLAVRSLHAPSQETMWTIRIEASAEFTADYQGELD
jgi:hypothetical protein